MPASSFLRIELRVVRGGCKSIEQIDRPIQVNDRLLLALSEHSMNSEWVKTEIRKARQAELRLPKSSETSEVFPRQRQYQKLFPIRLVSLDRIRDWSCFDADTGQCRRLSPSAALFRPRRERT